MTGFSREEFLGKHLWEIGLFKDIAASRSLSPSCRPRKYVRYEDLPLKTRDGRKIDVEFVSNVYRVDNQKVIQCNIRDITERSGPRLAGSEISSCRPSRKRPSTGSSWWMQRQDRILQSAVR